MAKQVIPLGRLLGEKFPTYGTIRRDGRAYTAARGGRKPIKACDQIFLGFGKGSNGDA